MSRGLLYTQLHDLLRKYVTYADIEPDESFTPEEHARIMRILQSDERTMALRNYRRSPLQNSVQRRIKGFLANHSEYSWSKAEIVKATGDPINSVCSGLIRLQAQGLIQRISWNRYQIRIERKQLA